MDGLKEADDDANFLYVSVGDRTFWKVHIVYLSLVEMIPAIE
jgi:hypothetical protein